MGSVLCAYPPKICFKRKQNDVGLVVDDSQITATTSTFEEPASDVHSNNLSFQWSTMQSLLLHYTTNTKSTKLTRQDIIAADKLLVQVETDISYHGKVLHDRFLCIEKDYLYKFEEHTKQSNFNPRSTDVYTSSLGHVVSVMQVHKKVLNALQFDENALQILELVALSHTLMKVTPSDFRLMNLITGKHLMTSEMGQGANVAPLISYLNFVTEYICSCIEKSTSRENMLEDMIVVSKTIISNSRKNYRLMKKWYNIVEKLRNECTVDIRALFSTSGVAIDVPVKKPKSEEEMITSCDL